MIMTSRLRKLALTARVTFSVGWLGAVAVVGHAKGLPAKAGAT